MSNYSKFKNSRSHHNNYQSPAHDLEEQDEPGKNEQAEK